MALKVRAVRKPVRAKSVMEKAADALAREDQRQKANEEWRMVDEGPWKEDEKIRGNYGPRTRKIMADVKYNRGK